MSKDKLPALLTAPDVGKLLNISRPTVQRLTRAGVLPAPVLSSGRVQRWNADSIIRFARGDVMELREFVVIPPIVGSPSDAMSEQLRKVLELVVEALERSPISQLDGHAWMSARCISSMALQIAWLVGGDFGQRGAYGDLPLDRVPVGNFRVKVLEGASGAVGLLFAADILLEGLMADPATLRALQADACRSEVLRVTSKLAELMAGLHMHER